MDYKSAQRNLWIGYCYMIMIVIYAGSASEFVFSIESWQHPLGFFIPIAATVGLAIYKKMSFSIPFILLLLGFFVYFLASTLKFQSFHPRFLASYLISFFMTYVIINAFKQHFFIMYIRIIYYLCILSLFFWVVQLAAPDALKGIMQQLTVTSPNEEHLNVLVYTFEAPTILDDFTVPRNSGFAWEPGAFATFINLAVFSLFITKKFNVLHNKEFWVLIGTLATTMSTTGYSTLMILLTFYAYNQKSKYFVALVPVIIALGFYVSTLPFMSDKMVKISRYNTQELIYNSVTWGFVYRPQRLESFQIDFIDFKNHPIIGYGGHNEAKWTEQLGAKINTVSGIGNLMALFGSVGVLFFLFQLVRTSQNYAEDFGYKGWGFLTLLILMIAISYALILTPLLMCFWLMRSKFLPKFDLLKFKLFSYLLALNK